MLLNLVPLALDAFGDKGLKKATFSLATNDYYTNNKGEKTEKTEWHNVVAWGNLAEKISDGLVKGDKIMVQGSLSHRKYDDASGVTRYFTEVIINDFIKFGKN